ncbi:hypothetical protein [Pedobacter borealis]|uniref:hypothetical protein n=1 Tax=Pedobacter borealis TaxID=475254 RepID=UPI00049372C7|nr:hypothetical protein [Pedobacter borealis]
MNFTSLKQIKEEFKLDGIEKNELRSQLRIILANSHPDKVGTEKFNSDDFTKIQDALSFIDSHSTDLVVNEQVTSLIEIVKELTTTNQINSTQNQFNDVIDNFYKEKKEALLFPKISLSVVTAILTFLWLFPKTVEDHPVLKKYITFENPTSTVIWFALLIYTVLFWVLISRKEQKDKSVAKRLKTERIQNKLLANFKDKHDTKEFAKSELIEFIDELYGVRHHSPLAFLLIGRSGIDQETIENLANLIIDKAKSKGLIAEIDNKKTLDDVFEWK